MPQDFDPILVADIRATAPPMRAEFRAVLDDRVAKGFMPDGGPRAWWAAAVAKAAPHRGMLLPAMGIATTLIVALVVVVSATHDSGGNPKTFGLQPAPAVTVTPGGAATGDTLKAVPPAELDRQAAPESTPSAGVAAAAAPVPKALSKSASPGFGRKVEHQTELSLSTSAGKLQDTADGVVRVTQNVGGIVEHSSVDSTDSGGTASFTLSIPSARLADAVKQLSKLAHVSSMSQGATDITRSFVSSASKLSDARAERKALLKALGVATTPERIATLKARLRNNRSEIAVYNGQLQALRRRADNTTVNVTVTGSGHAAAGSGGGWTFHKAAKDTLKVLEVVASIIMISAAILVPLALLAALATLTLRSATRRRREQVLEA